MIYVIADIQHAGVPSRPTDMGANYDLDGDGVRGENGEREVDLVRGYVAELGATLRAAGVGVTVIDSGTYDARHVQAAVIAANHDGPVVYLACHTNAGGGGYGLLRPDYRSRRGAGLATAIGVGLAMLPGITKIRTDPLYPTAMAAKAGGRDTSSAALVGWWTRGWSCIDGIYTGPSNLCGVLVEPFFIDASAHRHLTTPEGLRRVGRALADGVIAFGSAS